MPDDVSKLGQLLQKESAFLKVELQIVLTAPHEHFTQIDFEVSHRINSDEEVIKVHFKIGKIPKQFGHDFLVDLLSSIRGI